MPQLGRILVTGGSGYIGGHLVPELLARGYRVRVMVRGPINGFAERWPGTEAVSADALQPDSLPAALEDVHTAYYLIHSLLLGPEEFQRADAESAANFRRACEKAGVKRIIYLGGLGNAHANLSSHLRSRIEVANALSAGPVQTTVLRAAMIIGEGSASYEIIKNLVCRLPVILIPWWARSRCQPIAVRDVIRYLMGVLETPETAGQRYDVGGLDVLSYEQMMRELAVLLGLHRTFIRNRFFANVATYSYIGSLLTPVPPPITRCLMEGLQNDVVCLSNHIRGIVPFEPLTYREAIVSAMTREEQDRVSTRWSNAYPPAHELAIKLHELQRGPAYSGTYSRLSQHSSHALFESFCRIGGDEGWFQGNWMWRVRGLIDRILAGVGTQRGRRSSSELLIGDVIDFWRVEDIQPDTRLLLRAEMKLPGKAWLEFTVTPEAQGNLLTLTAYYETRTLLGRAYWFFFLPFHYFIFTRLLVQIDQRCRKQPGPKAPHVDTPSV